MLKQTPFHSRTGPLCQAQNWRRWAGYIVASSYELTHDREYYAIRTAAALFDVSPLYKYSITGPDAERLLNRVTTRNIRKCSVGQVMYTTWCDERGKVIDDGTVARLDDDEFRLTAAEPNLRWLRDNGVGLDVRVVDISYRMAALSLQGPLSRNILNIVTSGDVEQLGFFRLTNTTIEGCPVAVSRTGYTGDLGYEIWLDPSHAETVWDALMAAGRNYGIVPSGMLALDVARIEAGLILIDVDYVPVLKARIADQMSSPFELGLAWTVNLDKGRFNGLGALRKESTVGPAWHLCGVEVDWDSLERLYARVHLPPAVPSQAWRTSVPIYNEIGQIGYATSGCWSPILKKYIALAHIDARHAHPGAHVQMEVTVEHHRRRATARIVKTPFFNPPRKRALA